MNKSIVKRLEALEQKRNVKNEPTLIMIHYETFCNKWVIKETYCNDDKNKDESSFKSNVIEVESLQDYHFLPTSRNSRVIIDAYESPDPNIYGSLFCFDAKELWDDSDGYNGSLYIEAIHGDDSSLNAEIIVGKVLVRL